MKRARMLLRVSSSQQLEADGDLHIQRQIVQEYIKGHSDWELDGKEYFEGSNSGYKNAVADRSILQEALRDAQRKEYDILVAYKDDRIGRRIWDIGAYVMELKNYGVFIYTVKDGCITPGNAMEEIMLALRYGNAQKSSADTGQRVKDTAQKLVQKGKFMGGAAPYGYQLKLSGEISKHGRALHCLAVVPRQAEVVKHIYSLSLNKEFGSAKIARTLNEDDAYKDLAPNDVWKSGTIASILTNPIYAGRVAYKRRERVGGGYRRLDSAQWILSEQVNEDIAIIDSGMWNAVQEKRRLRGGKFMKKGEVPSERALRRNDGALPLVDRIYCGYCGCKLVNGSRYNYWKIKSTGEKKSSRTSIYKCQNAWQGAPHAQTRQFQAKEVEPAVFDAMGKCIKMLFENEDVCGQIEKSRTADKKDKEKELNREKKKLFQIKKEIAAIDGSIPKTMAGGYPLSLEELVKLKRRHERSLQEQAKEVARKEAQLNGVGELPEEWENLREKFPTWQEVFFQADVAAKRVLVNQLIERIDVKKNEVAVRFKVNPHKSASRSEMSGGCGVPEQGL